MEVKIGVADSPRELLVNSGQTPEEVESLVSAALEGDLPADQKCPTTDLELKKKPNLICVTMP